MFGALFPILALVVAAIHIAIDRKKRSVSKSLEIILLYQLVISTGLGGIFGFIGHSMRADETAKFIGWRAGSPFQFEIAIANLSFGILGVLCFWFRGNFWTATIIGTTAFGWGAAYGHIVDIMRRQNLSPGNAGWPLYLDIAMPIVMWGLLVALVIVGKKKKR